MNILKIDKPILVNNILHSNDNLSLVDYLFTNTSFKIASDDVTKKNEFETAMSNETQHSGFLFAPKNRDNNAHIFSCPLTTYGFVITNQIAKSLGFTYKEIIRITYNYYCRDQFAQEHKDSENDNDISIIYNPFTTDGGTVILGEKYQDIASQAKVFRSNWLHNSWSTVKDKARVSLNIVIKI